MNWQFTDAARAAGGVALVLLCASNAGADAEIEILSQTGTSLSVQFTDAADDEFVLAFSRPTSEDLWKADPEGETTGIIFGNTDPVFATPSRLATKSITPEQAIKTFDTTITGRPMSDISLYQLPGDEVVICLWQEDVITEMWFVSTFVEEFDFVPPIISACQQSLARCCRQTPIPGGGTGNYPNPSIANCLAVIQTCGTGFADSACTCLDEACDYCDVPSNATVCATVPGLQTLSDNACANYLTACFDPIESELVPMLGVALDRIQAIIDTHN